MITLPLLETAALQMLDTLYALSTMRAYPNRPSSGISSGRIKFVGLRWLFIEHEPLADR